MRNTKEHNKTQIQTHNKNSHIIHLNLQHRKAKEMTIALTAIASILIITQGLLNTLSDNLEISNSQYKSTDISLYMNQKNSLECVVNSLCIETKDANKNLNISNFEWFEQDGLWLNAFKIGSNMCYVQYSNADETFNREMALSKSHYNGIDTSELNVTNSRILYVDKVNNNKVASSTFLNTYIILSESSTDRTLDNNNYNIMLSNIEDKLYVTDNSEYDIKLNLNNIGTIDINKLSDKFNNIELTYVKSDGMIKVASSKDKEDYFYISCINNNVVDYMANEFEASEINGVYTSIRDTKSNDMDYETIAVLGKTELFIIRVNEKYKNTLIDSILTQLNLK